VSSVTTRVLLAGVMASNDLAPVPFRETNGNDQTAPSFTALFAARKFRNNVTSDEKRAERSKLGAKLRAELPPGPLPDTTPPSTSKLLARLMSKDGMTPGDRLRKQDRLRVMETQLEKENNPGVGEKSETDLLTQKPVSSVAMMRTPNPPEESPTTYFAENDMETPSDESGLKDEMDMEIDTTENTTVAIPWPVKRLDEMSPADYATPEAGTKSAPRSPVSPAGSRETLPKPVLPVESVASPEESVASPEDLAAASRQQQREKEANARSAAETAELVASAQRRAEAEAVAVAKAREEARIASVEAARAEADAARMATELATARRVAREEVLAEGVRLAEEKDKREQKAIAKSVATAERHVLERAEREREARAERERRDAAVANAASARAAEGKKREAETLLARAAADAALEAERALLAEEFEKAEQAARVVEAAEALEKAAALEAAQQRALFEQRARGRFEQEAKARAVAEAAEGAARAEAEAATLKKRAEVQELQAIADADEANARKADEAKAVDDLKARQREASDAASRVRARLANAHAVTATASEITDAPGTPPGAAPASPKAAAAARTNSPSPSRGAIFSPASATSAAPVRAGILSPTSPHLQPVSNDAEQMVSPPWSVRSARTAEEDDELPLHCALAAEADAELIAQLLRIDPGGAFVKDKFGDLPLHVALRVFAPPATIQSLLRLFPESYSKRDANGVTPSQLALAYDSVVDEEQVVSLVRFAKREVRRNCEKTRSPRRRAAERVLVDTLFGVVIGGFKVVGGAGAGVVRGLMFRKKRGKRARRVKKAKEKTSSEPGTPDSSVKSRRRKLFNADGDDADSCDVSQALPGDVHNTQRARRRASSMRVLLNFGRKGVTACGAAYGTLLAATIAGRLLRTKLTTDSLQRRERERSVRSSTATAVSSNTVAVQETPNVVDKILGTAHDFVQVVEVLKPPVVVMPLEHMIRIDRT
jgi:hypothetical protein